MKRASLWIGIASICVLVLFIKSWGTGPHRAFADDPDTPEPVETVAPENTPEPENTAEPETPVAETPVPEETLVPETPDPEGDIGIEDVDLTDEQQAELLDIVSDDSEPFADIPQNELDEEDFDTSSLPTNADDFAGSALVRFLYISPNPSQVDVYIDKDTQPAAAKLESMNATKNYTRLASGNHTFTVTEAGNRARVLLHQSFQLLDQSAFTIVLDVKPITKTRRSDGIILTQLSPVGVQAFVMRDMLQPTTGNGSRVVVNLFAQNTPQLNLASASLKTVFPTALRYGERVEVGETKKNTANVTLVDTQKGVPSPTTALFSAQKINIRPDQVYNIIIVAIQAAQANTQPTLKAIVLVSPTVTNYKALNRRGK